MNEQGEAREKIFATYTSGKVFVSIICKWFLQVNSKKTNCPI